MKWKYDHVSDAEVAIVGPCRCTVEYIDRIGPDEDMRGNYSQPQQRWNVSLLGVDEYGLDHVATLAEGWAKTEKAGQEAALAFLLNLSEALVADLKEEP